MEYKGFTYTPAPKTAWDNLSMLEKSEMMKVAVRNGITDLKTIKEKYNEFAEGGKIHIKDSKKGTFTAAAKKHGMGVQEFASKVLANKDDYSPAMRRKANFARNASKWHGEGGNLFEEAEQMHIGKPFWQSQTQQPSFMESLAEFNRQQEIKKQQQRQALRERINTISKKLAEDKMREASVESNDNAWVETPLLTRKKNAHLSRRAEEGAKIHAAWVKEHPVLNTIGTALGAAPFAIATTPLLAAAGEAAAPVLANPYIDAALTSGFGSHGLNHAVNEGIDGWGDATMTALEVAPLGRVIKPMAQEAASAAKTLYDNGTLWDAYTTFGGRFGNYGDNIFTNMYGTAARRFGLPDKARVPADGIRKIADEPRTLNGLVNLTGNKGWFSSPHINATIDRPVVSHASGWDGMDTYLFPFRDFVSKSGKALKSVEPSDVFSNGVAFMEEPSRITLISGDVEALQRAKDAGMQTLSSPKLRRLYSNADNAYKANKLPNKPPKKSGYWKNYADEIQRLQSQRGTPTMADFKLLEQETGLTTGVAPLSEYDNAYNGLNRMMSTMKDPKGIRMIMNGEVTPYVYPNGREVNWVIQDVFDELRAIQRAKYNNVFYDPTTYTESIWRSESKPKW